MDIEGVEVKVLMDADFLAELQGLRDEPPLTEEERAAEEERQKAHKAAERELDAQEAAAFAGGRLLWQRWRGVIDCDDKIVIYINDDQDDYDRLQERAIALLKDRLQALGYKETASADGPDQCSWAIVIYDTVPAPASIEAFQDLLEAVWADAAAGVGDDLIN